MDQAMETMIHNLKERTGKSLEEWVGVARSSGHKKHGEIVKFLKTEHQIGHGYANLITMKALSGESPAGEEDLVAAQYADKWELRPIYDSLIAAIKKFGSDVEISPKKTYVSLRRKKQFGLIQPSTKTRIDVGITLKGTAAKGRLENSGSFNAMVSHRVRVEKPADVNAELSWMVRISLRKSLNSYRIESNEACSSAWYELRTSGPDSTCPIPIASPRTFQERNSSG
jgi:hypothetical protein